MSYKQRQQQQLQSLRASVKQQLIAPKPYVYEKSWTFEYYYIGGVMVKIK